MTLIRGLRPEPLLNLVTERLEIRSPLATDYEAWAELRARSRRFLEPWEPVWPSDDLTQAAYRRRIRRYQREARDSEGFAFFLIGRHDGEIKGGLSLSNVRWGVTLACSLGYWMGAPFAGRGFMIEAVCGIATHVFETLRLHRIEAACLPENERSKHVLARCGFVGEGLARDYLRINGRWRDHLLFALLASDPRPVVQQSETRRDTRSP